MQNINPVRFISFNSCNMDTFTLVTSNSLKRSPDHYQIDFYLAKLTPEQLKEFDPECLSVYELLQGSRPYAIEDFIKEAFGNLLKELIGAFGEDEREDFLPASIEEFFSVLQTFSKSDNPDIKEGLAQCNLDLWASIYNTYMQKAPGYIDTDILTWEQGMNQTPRFPAFLL